MNENQSPKPDSSTRSDAIDRIIALGEEHGLRFIRQPHVSPNCALAEQLLRQRRQREAVFGAHLFADPCWDMLLDLYVSQEKGLRPVSTSSLCIASAVPTTTALRWIELLIREQLVYKRPDPRDRRRVLIHLSDEAKAKLDELLGRWVAKMGERGQTPLNDPAVPTDAT